MTRKIAHRAKKKAPTAAPIVPNQAKKEAPFIVEAENSIKVGRFDIQKIEGAPNQYVPTATNLINSHDELEIIALSVKENLPALLIGETGTGKTSFIRHLARLTNNGFRRLNLNGSTTIEEFIGHYVVDDKNTSGHISMRWIDGVLLDAMRNGYWLLLDELNAALPEVLFVLQSVLDDDRYYVVAEHDGEVVRPHQNFRVFATMNPSFEYAGTKDLNKALLSRFPIVIQTEYPDVSKESDIIKMHVPAVKQEDLALMVRVAQSIRQGKTSGNISMICSTRELINWGKLSQHYGMKEASKLAILNKCEIASDKKTIEDILKMQFGKWDKKQLLSFDEMEKQIAEEKENHARTKNSLKDYEKAYRKSDDSHQKIVETLNSKKSDSAKIITLQHHFGIVS